MTVVNLRDSKATGTSCNDMPPFDPLATAAELRKRGLCGAAEQIEFLFWAWERTIGAYVLAIPYLPEEEKNNLHVVNKSAFDFWGPKIVGAPVRDDRKVLAEAEADERWHKYGPEARAWYGLD